MRTVLLAVWIVLCGTLMSLTNQTQAQDSDRQFMIAVIPDTQRYSAYNINVFKSQTQWIADHASERDIRFVLHLGDITENDTVIEEWQGADEAMRILDDAGIPYAIVAGNHDIVAEVPDDERPLDGELYPVYFPPERTENSPTYGGHTPNGWNSYYTFEGAGQTFMVIALDYVPSDATIEWAQDVIKAHADLPVILIAHDIVTSTCDLGDEACTNGAVLSETGQRLWNDLITSNDQIFMTINGHSWPPEHMTLVNDLGNPVQLMLTNYQAEHYGGNGWMRLLEFDLDANAITATTFSPWVLQKPENRRGPSDLLDRTDPRNQFVIDLDFAARFANFSP